LSSVRSVGDCARYAAGILVGSELHLTPVKAAVTLRPDLTYLVRNLLIKPRKNGN